MREKYKDLIERLFQHANASCGTPAFDYWYGHYCKLCDMIAVSYAPN